MRTTRSNEEEKNEEGNGSLCSLVTRVSAVNVRFACFISEEKRSSGEIALDMVNSVVSG